MNSENGFWDNFKKPIIGLSPMDGVTDAPFRFITAKYGKPDVMMTEFTSVEGISAGAEKALMAFIYSESERPIIAQVFGSTPEAFYKAAFVVAELGFDGLDINMGCPASNIASKGAGAALIQTPDLAKNIIKKAKSGLHDWANGIDIENSGLPENIIQYVRKRQPTKRSKKMIPVSVKTRIGYNSIVIEEWVKHLLEEQPANISIHGRTLKQLYSGQADWEAIGRAATIIHKTSTRVLGNGDIKNIDEAQQKIQTYGLDGALIGRASFGNPWIFKNIEISINKKLAVAIEHSKYYQQIFGERLFFPMRKHLAWYCRGFENASEVRQKCMTATNANDVEKILGNMNITG